MEKQLTECFWCQTVYDKKQSNLCPECSSNLNTKEISIIYVKDNQES